jgi:aldose 1-epimerase
MVTRSRFGTLPDGRGVDAFTIQNGNVEMCALNWGGIITSLLTPDRTGTVGDVVLGYETLEPYLTASPYFGCIVGRFANRIAGARFSLDGKQVQLAANDGRNHLHGGWRGFDKQLWDAREVRTPAGDGVVLSRVSHDGEEGYPGELRVRVQYVLTANNRLEIDYEAETDAPTVVNLTQHSYFNLAGHSDDVLGHWLQIEADAFTPVTAELIPTGTLTPVAGTPFDFRTLTPIGARISDDDEQLHHGLGFDHNWVMRRGAGLKQVATLVHPPSGRILDVLTTAPGLQFYSGNQLDGSLIGKGGWRYVRHAGLCLETQLFPDSPNQASFPSAVLRPGDHFHSRTVFHFRRQ